MMCLVGIFAGEHVGVEVFIRGVRPEPFQMRLIAGGEFGFVRGDVAVGAGLGEHVMESQIMSPYVVWIIP